MSETAALERPLTTGVYLHALLPQVPRLLGLLNRNPASSTYGCFDRNYWHYRLLDTPSARCQEAALTLALLHQIPGTLYSGQPALRVWVNAALRFWLTIQLPSGAFNEWYPNEHSFVATAFTTYAASEAGLCLGSPQIEDWPAFARGLARAGRWLLRAREDRVLNQVAGSALALYNVFLVTQDRAFEQGARERLGALRARQNPEGWFAEYGGADAGYLSLTVAYLAKLHRKSGWAEARGAAVAASDFLEQFLHRNGTSGGAYSSRFTEYLIPDGVELLAAQAGSARAISAHIRRALEEQRGVSIFSFDDRYLLYVGYNFLEAFRCGASGVEGQPEEPAPLAADARAARVFPEAGVVTARTPAFESVINVRRGGAFKVVFANGKSVSDGGITLRASGRTLSGGFWNPDAVSEVEEGRVVVRGLFSRAHETPLTPWRAVWFRLFQASVGALGVSGWWVKELLRNLLIMPSPRKGLRYERVITLRDDVVRVSDRIHNPGGQARLERITLGAGVSFVYTPSSRFFPTSDLDEPAPVVVVPARPRARQIVIVRTYAMDGALAAFNVDEGMPSSAEGTAQ